MKFNFWYNLKSNVNYLQPNINDLGTNIHDLKTNINDLKLRNNKSSNAEYIEATLGSGTWASFLVWKRIMREIRSIGKVSRQSRRIFSTNWRRQAVNASGRGYLYWFWRWIEVWFQVKWFVSLLESSRLGGFSFVKLNSSISGKFACVRSSTSSRNFSWNNYNLLPRPQKLSTPAPFSTPYTLSIHFFTHSQPHLHFF